MYLPTLTIRLATGLGNVPQDQRNRHAAFFLRRQRHDGGFAGREGDSDLYYTGFALRALAMLGELSGEPAERAAGFLHGKLAGQTPVVDFLALIQAANLLEMAAGIDIFADSQPNWRESVAAMLETFRRDDGGYAKGPEGNAGSTYHSFLVVLCQQLIAAPTVEPDRLAAFVHSQRRDDGGFVEIRAMRRSGTNPTAAAIALLKTLDRLDHETAEAAVDFLLDMQTDEGGLRANTRIPIADLLSTFTGLLTLSDLGYARELDLDALRRYVRSLEQPDGGFHGAAWDEATDVEYAFYGLGALALLQ
jgi:geranylgeranyl transferase type-2 subunit beta